MPVLSPEEMNCADTRRTVDAGITSTQAGQIATLLDRAYEAKAISFTHSSPKSPLAHLRGFYVLAFCGIRRDGQMFVIVDGIYKFMGATICDDAAGFGIVYDPRKRSFGKMSLGVSSCALPARRQ
jgi:hypothetical protein